MGYQAVASQCARGGLRMSQGRPPRTSQLFVLGLSYGAGLELVEQHLSARRAYLEKHYRAGTFLASGRKEPRTGGVILAQGERATIGAIIATDPCVVHGAARYAVTELLPTTTGAALRESQVVLPG